MNPKKPSSKVTRRSFLAKSAQIGAAIAVPTIIPSHVLAKPGRPGANDRILIGNIGVGGMGKNHVGEETIAVCDVDKNHLAAAVEKAKEKNGGKTVDAYGDYRRVLERKDIDAVMIATPDHWHGIIMVNACQAGKDVYVEKPACHTLEEGKAMIEATHRYGRVVQVGSQGRSTEDAHAACTFIRNGNLGEVKKVTCWHVPNREGGFEPNCDPPPELDWDFWLGPMRYVPYNPERCHFNFRWFLDYGAGFIRDRGAHVFSVMLWCMNQDRDTPVTVEAHGTPPKSGGIFDVPTELEITYKFHDPEWTVVWAQPGDPAADWDFGMKFWGDKDTLYVKGGDGGCHTEDKALNYTPPAGGVTVFQSPGHRQNWFDCIKSREKPLMDIVAGVRVSQMCIIGNLAYILKRPLQWDPVKQQFVNDDEANRYVRAPGRGQYHL
jgi:predicted dehydrogenase